MMTPLTLDEAVRIAPSIASETSHPDVSPKFRHISTKSVLERFVSDGWLIREVKETKARIGENRPYAEHLVRMFHPSSVPQRVVGELIPEVVLRNSHNGLHSYSLMAGIFRLVCSNGMVVPESMMASVRIRHSGSAIAELLDQAYEATKGIVDVIPAIDGMKVLDLDEYERTQFANKAIAIRYGEDPEDRPKNVPDPASILVPRRSADAGSSLWCTLNTVQEYLLKGGEYSDGPFVWKKIKGIKAVSEDIRVNQALWEEANQILKAHSVAAV